MKKNWQKAIVTKKVQINKEISSLYLKTESKPYFDFEPGQFITLDLPIGTRCIERWRSYSIASAPQDASNIHDIELCISKHQMGEGAAYLCDEVEVGHELKYKGPAGYFTMDIDPDSTIIMICTEAGIAPFRSMLRSLQYSTIYPRRIELVHIVNYDHQLLYKDEMYDLMEKIPNFRYSADVCKDKFWIGCDKNISSKLIDKYTETGEKLVFYLCGWPDMVTDMISYLINERGFDKDQVFYEIYR